MRTVSGENLSPEKIDVTLTGEDPFAWKLQEKKTTTMAGDLQLRRTTRRQ
jgi:hypothetical protein